MKWKFLGPGLLYVGASVGVSHLVQSTRVGALYGFELLSAVIIVNLLKYPFFEIGTRFTIVTGRPLQEAYKEIGLWALFLFLAIIVTMFINISVVIVVTAALLLNLFALSIDVWLFSG